MIRTWVNIKDRPFIAWGDNAEWGQVERSPELLSPRSTLIVAEGSGHDVHIERPDIVIDAVRRMAKALEVKR